MSKLSTIRLVVNGEPVTHVVENRTLLVTFLRDQLQLTGTHIGCDTSNCGACTVAVDGRATKSCTFLAVQADGRDVQTVEGLGAAGELSALQVEFSYQDALQCGYCTPGMLMSATTFVREHAGRDVTRDEIREGVAGNLCRCTGYSGIIDAIEAVLGGAALPDDEGTDDTTGPPRGRPGHDQPGHDRPGTSRGAR